MVILVGIDVGGGVVLLFAIILVGVGIGCGVVVLVGGLLLALAHLSLVCMLVVLARLWSCSVVSALLACLLYSCALRWCSCCRVGAGDWPVHSCT